MFSPGSPVTGSAQTGLTSPTYTLTVDSPPVAHAKQWAVTTLGGTQTGVEVHSATFPFTLTAFKVASPKGLPTANTSTGIVGSIPRNVQKYVTRKGVSVNSTQTDRAIITTVIDLPAGADLVDPESVRAALSLHIGALSNQSAGVGDTACNNVL